MILSRVEPRPSGSDLRTFECQKCGRVQKLIVSKDPMNVSLRGWLNSDLKPPVSGSSVMTYQAYRIGRGGHHIRAVDLTCADDDAARKRALKIITGHDVEFWHYARKIANSRTRERSVAACLTWTSKLFRVSALYHEVAALLVDCRSENSSTATRSESESRSGFHKDRPSIRAHIQTWLDPHRQRCRSLYISDPSGFGISGHRNVLPLQPFGAAFQEDRRTLGYARVPWIRRFCQRAVARHSRSSKCGGPVHILQRT
jgi:hypothetical protein